MTEASFSNLTQPTNIFKGEKAFRKIINKAAATCIPSGRIKNIIPEIPTATAEKIKTRDELRSSDPHSPQIKQLNEDITREINTHRQEKWRETISNINGKTNSTKLYKLIKHLNGSSTNPSNNQSIKFKGKYIGNAKKLANAFNKQYTSITDHKSKKDTRKITRNIRKNKLEDAQMFTETETEEAIKKSKASKALGPDKISTLHLKHLGPAAIKYLTSLFNLSIKNSQIPDIWKTSTIIPLLKPNKPADDSGSYRPVSLLCPSIKILERLILPTLNEHLPIPDIQHGFRQQHSTVTALNDFTQDVITGFNQKKPAHRTVLLQLDLSKAFDMVSHNKLLKDLDNTTLPPAIKRWFNTYLRGRQSRVNFRDEKSTSRNIHTGVPQGAVTSPILFNFYLTNIPDPPNGVKLIQYADDISVYSTGPNINQLTKNINEYVPHLINFLIERELIVSPEKSTVTLFTPSTHEFNFHPQIIIDNRIVKLEQQPKLLGVTFDTLFKFSHHVEKAATKAKSKVNILKCLAGSKWGQDKETIVTTHKTIVRSTLEYAAPIWAPIISKTSVQKTTECPKPSPPSSYGKP